MTSISFWRYFPVFKAVGTTSVFSNAS